MRSRASINLNLSFSFLPFLDPDNDVNEEDEEDKEDGIDDPTWRGHLAFDIVETDTLTTFLPCDSDSCEALASNTASPFDSNWDLVHDFRQRCKSDPTS
jgi:hypothetical protein